MAYFNAKQKLQLVRSLFTKMSPAYVQFYITARCNLQCEQCNINFHNADLPEVPLEKIERIADNLKKIGVCMVLLIGGEPFVRKDLPEIIQIFTKRNIHVRMQTNGLASEAELVRCIEMGGHDISISLDSLDASVQDEVNGDINGSWEQILRTVAVVNKVMPKNGTAFFGTVIMPKNLSAIPRVIEFATKIGWGVSLVPVHTTYSDNPRGFRCTIDKNLLFNDQHYELLKKLISVLKSMKRAGYHLYDSEEYLNNIPMFLRNGKVRWRRFNYNQCDSPNLYFAIEPDGGIAPCCDYRLEERILVYKDDFPEKYYSHEFRKSVKKYTTSCNGCMYGSYPEISITARNYGDLLRRLMFFEVNRKPLPKLSYDQIHDLAKNANETLSKFDII